MDKVERRFIVERSSIRDVNSPNVNSPNYPDVECPFRYREDSYPICKSYECAMFNVSGSGEITCAMANRPLGFVAAEDASEPPK